MASSETLAIVDSEELRALKEKIDLEMNALMDSFQTLYMQYTEMSGSGWDDDNQLAFDNEINTVKQDLINKITEFKEVSGVFLDKKIQIIEEYCNFDMSL